MIPVKISDHVDAALDRKIEHYSGNKIVLDSVAFSHIDQYQKLEDATWEVIYKRLLDPAPGQSEGARGYQLDILGKLVGTKRQGYSDDEYVVAIRLQILINKSFGTNEDLLKIVRAAIGVSGVITERRNEIYHVAYYRLDHISPALALVLFRSMQKARPAGYRAILEYYTTNTDPSDLALFSWSDDDGDTLSGTGQNGFSWSDADGNTLAGVGATTAYQG